MPQIDEGYGYDDLLLQPAYSSLDSRSQPDLSLNLGPYTLEVPILSAPMDTVTNIPMASFLAKNGSMGILHRYCSCEGEQLEVCYCKATGIRVAASIGANGLEAYVRAVGLVRAGVDMLVIDVAQGDSGRVFRIIRELKRAYPSILILSANVATGAGALRALEAGADLLRVGVGAGSACTTSRVTGVGVPPLSAIMNVRRAVGSVPIIVADGGIRTSGDIVKALAAGANAVMLGGMLSCYSIAPYPGRLRGMASKAARHQYKGGFTSTPEGKELEVEIIYDYEEHFRGLVSAVKQGFAYLGAHNTAELHEKARWIAVRRPT